MRQPDNLVKPDCLVDVEDTHAGVNPAALTNLMKNFITTVAWLAGEDKQFHIEWLTRSGVVIRHTKTRYWSFEVNLNSQKSIHEAINVMICWGNGVFGPREELKFGL